MRDISFEEGKEEKRHCRVPRPRRAHLNRTGLGLDIALQREVFSSRIDVPLSIPDQPDAGAGLESLISSVIYS